jgi:ribosomal protein S4E
MCCSAFDADSVTQHVMTTTTKRKNQCRVSINFEPSDYTTCSHGEKGGEGGRVRKRKRKRKQRRGKHLERGSDEIKSAKQTKVMLFACNSKCSDWQWIPDDRRLTVRPRRTKAANCKKCDLN